MEMEVAFRETLHRLFPDHLLALHTTDIQLALDDDFELPTETVQELNDYLKLKQPTGNHPTTFHTTPIIIWLPTTNSTTATWINSIRHLFRDTPDNQLIAIATHRIANEVPEKMQPKDVLDAWMLIGGSILCRS
jgi:hypothetical protein